MQSHKNWLPSEEGKQNKNTHIPSNLDLKASFNNNDLNEPSAFQILVKVTSISFPSTIVKFTECVYFIQLLIAKEFEN